MNKVELDEFTRLINEVGEHKRQIEILSRQGSEDRRAARDVLRCRDVCSRAASNLRDLASEIYKSNPEGEERKRERELARRIGLVADQIDPKEDDLF